MEAFLYVCVLCKIVCVKILSDARQRERKGEKKGREKEDLYFLKPANGEKYAQYGCLN